MKKTAQNKSPHTHFSFVLNSQSETTRYYILTGQVFASEALYMEKELERAYGLGCNRIIINMALVKMFSSAGIKVILSFYKKMKSVGGTLKIDSPSETVKNIIGMVALDELSLNVRNQKITIPARLDCLNELLEFVGGEMQSVGTDEKIRNNIMIATEEIFVNISRYAYAPNEGDVTVCMSVNWDIITITFKDSGKPYDPLAKPDPDTSLPASEREIGGLGIYMAKKIMDEMSYEYHDRRNILTIRKFLDMATYQR